MPTGLSKEINLSGILIYFSPGLLVNFSQPMIFLSKFYQRSANFSAIHAQNTLIYRITHFGFYNGQKCPKRGQKYMNGTFQLTFMLVIVFQWTQENQKNGSIHLFKKLRYLINFGSDY